MDLSTSPIIYGILISDIIASIAGLFGGLSISFFWRPKKLNNYDKFVAALIIIIISISAAFSLVGIIAELLHVNISKVENAIGLGYLVGAISVGLVTLLANFFSYRENNDILDVASEIKQATKGVHSIDEAREKTPDDKNSSGH
ncbi:hypothetical protein ACI51Z_03135 [Pectobacterium carotovorum]|uniref:hypothetical protein n=1 Tax=Pectobacterium carotovorum TaxID=554 RepID=UPI00160069AC|nr:hypothetical protein [Pectobacterium carotovorum]MBB1525962.1 hypothetical protein [Pectobacterium carotovorum subsp. carotovorum]MCA6965935.1 hypothetical protein [Pectobacterium carotovorum]MCA6971919.1 hypothetical protein [Pectobacterium carotovorum]MCH4988357.1 hypothetical protein [Pectobacterium carotovorum]MCQ8232784.1 hypothetical protein [Pectobacterium carotovorum]